MTDTHPAPAVEDAAVAEVVKATEATSLEEKSVHVHGPDCNHDDEHANGEEQKDDAPQYRNDFDLLEVNGTKDKTTDPLVKVRVHC